MARCLPAIRAKSVNKENAWRINVIEPGGGVVADELPGTELRRTSAM
jgi:hypothetical protein